MEDTYIYLFLAIPFWLLAVVFYILRPDLRTVILISGLLGAILGPVSEFWYFQDYWIPPTLLGKATVSLEDVLFGSGVTAIAASVYKVATRQTLTREYQNKKRTVAIYFLMGFAALLVFTNGFGVNSIIVSSVAFILIGLLITLKRRDLMRQSLCVAVFLPLFAMAVYAPLFGLLAPDYLENYFLLSQHPFNPDLFGVMPLAEMLWYFSWGFLAGSLFDYASGKVLTPKQTNRPQ